MKIRFDANHTPWTPAVLQPTQRNRNMDEQQHRAAPHVQHRRRLQIVAASNSIGSGRRACAAACGTRRRGRSKANLEHRSSCSALTIASRGQRHHQRTRPHPGGPGKLSRPRQAPQIYGVPTADTSEPVDTGGKAAADTRSSCSALTIVSRGQRHHQRTRPHPGGPGKLSRPRQAPQIYGVPTADTSEPVDTGGSSRGYSLVLFRPDNRQPRPAPSSTDEAPYQEARANFQDHVKRHKCTDRRYERTGGYCHDRIVTWSLSVT